jgi:tetratricopeptide (TPR) repeat protein
MSIPKRYRRIAPIFLCLVVCGTQIDFAADNHPITLWPDTSTGLLWMGNVSPRTMSWQDAKNYCATLQLAGYSDWKLPTLQEAVTVKMRMLRPDGNIWTTNLSDVKQVIYPNLMKHKTRYAPCNRVMEPALLEVAKNANLSRQAPDIMTLKADAPLHAAWVAFGLGHNQDSIDYAKNALLIKPDFELAYWALGISCGHMGQWDLAIANLEAALKLDKDDRRARESLAWAKEGQETAKNGKSPKLQAPLWSYWY